MANVVQLRRPQEIGEAFELYDTEAACRLLQKELALMARTLPRGWMGKLAQRTGMSEHTVQRLLYGETTMPRFNTVIRLLIGLGFTVTARR